MGRAIAKDGGRTPLMKTTAKAGLGVFAGIWVSLHPLVQTLVILMGLDIVTGLIAGFVTRTLSSDVSYKGMAKKVLMLMVVVAVGIVQRTWQTDLPLGAIAAGFYCVHELLSILENVGRAGVPVPEALAQAIDKIRGRAQGTGLEASLREARERD